MRKGDSHRGQLQDGSDRRLLEERVLEASAPALNPVEGATLLSPTHTAGAISLILLYSIGFITATLPTGCDSRKEAQEGSVGIVHTTNSTIQAGVSNRELGYEPYKIIQCFCHCLI